MADILQTTWSNEWKLLNLKLNFIEICSLGSNSQYVSIGLDNALVPYKRQAIIWNNDDLAYLAYGN